MIQIDMEMPESCDECRFLDEQYYICFALCGMSTYDVRRGFRHKDCPLEEVDDDKNHTDRERVNDRLS